MSPHSTEIINQFFNAMQLSLTSTLGVIPREGCILFEELKENDPHIKLMEKLLPGHWASVGPDKDIKQVYYIKDFDKLDLALITNFLILTRLNKKNIVALAKENTLFYPLCKQLGLAQSCHTIDSLQAFANLLRSDMEQKGLTIRQLADMTVLTQLSISKFKSGSDIKLSNLMKVAHALGRRLIIE
jgi:hypothetical protein